MQPTLLILAAGMGSRYGGLKQLDPIGPGGEVMLDYSIYDALQAGFGRVVFVIRRDFADDFKTKVGNRFESRLQVDYAYQSADDLPSGFQPPEGRIKPWGTGHAVLAAREVVKEPFAVINADDFYGRDAYVKLGRFFEQSPSNASASALVAYRLKNTLSEYGSVSRGLCTLDEKGCLSGVRELTKIVRTANGAENRELPESPEALTGEEFVSLNTWGFTPEIFTLLSDCFETFLKERGTDPKAEFYLPAAVDSLIHQGRTIVSVLDTSATWFGITYKEDKPLVESSLCALAAAGEYPTPLWA